jgi:hypothetical protein
MIMRLDLRRYMTFGVGAAAMAVLVSGQTPSSGGKPTAAAPAPTPSPTAAVQPSSAEFDDFMAVAGKPAASAPIRKLPHVRLATVSVAGIPPVPLAAYRKAAHSRATLQPGCHLPWWLLAGIGFIESGHAHSGGSTHAGWNGLARPPIYGPVLDGSHGFKAISDTDNGRLDGDRRWDRAVGPMQFLPSTWQRWAPTTNANPQNIFAAAGATAGYLCAGGSDISKPHPMALAVYSYNHSFDYVRLVLSVGARYAGMSPDELGVNLLPKDHPKSRHRAKHHRHKNAHHDSARGSHRSASTSTASPSPSASSSPSPSPSPSPSSQPLPNPLPTLSPLGIH